jgi:hypothetical protein
MERQHCSASDQLEPFRAAQDDLNDQIDKSRKTVHTGIAQQA